MNASLQFLQHSKVSCYKLLRNIETNIDVKFDFFFNFGLCLWVRGVFTLPNNFPRKLLTAFSLLTIFTKSSTIDVSQGSKYASEGM